MVASPKHLFTRSSPLTIVWASQRVQHQAREADDGHSSPWKKKRHVWPRLLRKLSVDRVRRWDRSGALAKDASGTKSKTGPCSGCFIATAGAR